MANKAHASLTGADLHEPKGADTAASNLVYRTDGVGSGTWTKLDANSLTGTGNSFGSQLLHVREAQSSGVASTVSLATTTWTRRILNTTLTNELASAGLGVAPASSNQILLQAGTYFAMARGTVNESTSSHNVRLYDVTHSTALVYGMASLISDSIQASLMGRFTLSAQSVVELQHITGAPNSGGGALSLGGGETYAEAMIWKVA